jgi:hypothetical protein
MTILLSQEQMEKRVEASALAKMVTENGRSFLGKIINMGESSVSMHTPDTKT